MNDLSWDGSSLREETRNVQEHVFELLISLIVVSILLGLAISLFASWLFQVLNQQLLAPIIAGCVIIVVILIFSYLFRILTTIKEFHKEIEIPLPLLVSKQDVEVIQVRYYDRVTDLLHAALERRTIEERKQIAQSIQSLHRNNAAARHEISEFVLELMQLLLTSLVVRGSARLLGSQAPFHKFREVSQLQSSTIESQWSKLVEQVPNNHYFQDTLPGIPQNVILPTGVELYLPDVAQQISEKLFSDKDNTQKLVEVTLLKATVGGDTALNITALTAFSEYRLPKPKAPRDGLTTRCIMRNARNQSLQDLVCEEELIATQLNDDGQALQPVNQGELEPVEHYASIYNKLYASGKRPYLLRVFVRFDGKFRISQFRKNEKRQYGLYAWGTELARFLAQIDIEEFMSTLKDNGQRTPHRVF